MFFDHYPYTNFHNVNLDWVLQAVKAWGRTVEANDRAFKDLKEANESFKAYVKNYLQDLDITDEINTKLDRMLAEGTLTPYFAPYVKGYVESWLANNVTPTTPALDKTLSLDDAAANAAATGERIESAAYLRTLDGPKLSNLLNKNLIIPGYRIQSACNAGGYFYVCGGSEAADGKGFIAKMSSLDFKDAEITYYTDLGHANDITYSYTTNHLYVTTVGEGVEWGIWNINPNDLTDKTLITNCPENTIGIQYVDGWVFVLAPPRIYRTLDFETYTLVINNTNDILNKFSIQSDGRISQTLVRLPNNVVGWVGSYIKEPEHIWYGFIAYFGSHGAITFDVFPTYNAECQAAIWDGKSTVYVISNGTTSPAYTVLRMDCGDLKYLELGAGEDLNNYTGEGLFYLIGAATMDNCPVNNEGLTLKVSRQGLLNTRQDIFTNSGRHLYRIKLFNAGTWDEWVEQAAEIAQIKEDLSVLNANLTPLTLIWEQGTFNVNTGGKNAATNRVRTKYKVSLNSLGYIAMYCPAGWQLGGRRYTQNNAQTYLGTIPAFTGMKLFKHTEHTMYAFYVRRNDNADITPSDVPSEVKIIPIYLPHWDTNAHGLSIASFRTTRNNPLYVRQICDVAETYYEHRSDRTDGVADMQYGFDSATRVDTYTRQIDCSTFVTLCLLGIPYTDTQYYTKTDTPASSLAPNPQYAWSVDPRLYDYYPDDLTGEPNGGAKASQLAEWMIDMGWRVPKDKKLLNLEVGDILFYARTNETGSQLAQPDRFMCINHVAICTDKQKNTSGTGFPYTYTLTEVTNVRPCVRKAVVENGWDTPDVINVNNYNTLVLICRPDLGSIQGT